MTALPTPDVYDPRGVIANARRAARVTPDAGVDMAVLTVVDALLARVAAEVRGVGLGDPCAVQERDRGFDEALDLVYRDLIALRETLS